MLFTGLFTGRTTLRGSDHSKPWICCKYFKRGVQNDSLIALLGLKNIHLEIRFCVISLYPRLPGMNNQIKCFSAGISRP
jgi:hypothetical protein